MVHDYLKDVLHEEDEENTAPAGKLKDLYDCHACANHIAQVYLKGIIFPKSEREFGVNEIPDKAELSEIKARVLDTEKRRSPIKKTEKSPEAEYIDPDKISQMEEIRIIDVRTPEKFAENHIRNSVNIPLHRINLNPHIISDDKYSPLVFVCENGTNAEFAAGIAIASGYMNVYYSKM